MSSDEKNNEMTPVNHRIALTRRAALGICAGTAATWLMSPLAAFASYDNLGGVDIGSCRVWDWSDGSKSHDFGSQGDIVGDYFQMNYGNSGYTKNTSWMKWNMWGDNWLGTALCLEAKTDYENALFSHVTYYPLVAGLSAMEYESYRHWGWQPSGRDDSYYELQQSINGAVTTLATHSFDTDTTANTVKGYNDYDIDVHTSGGTFWTDFELWASPWSDKVWRKDLSELSIDVRMYGEWWYFWVMLFDAYDEHAKGYTRWLNHRLPPIDATKGTGYANCGVYWAGRIVAIVDAGSNNTKSLIIGDGTNLEDAGTWVLVWPKGDDWDDCTCRLNRGWYMNLNTAGVTDRDQWSNNNKWRGTISIINAMQLSNARAANLDQEGGGYGISYGTLDNGDPMRAQIYGANGSAAQAFWIHTATVDGRLLQYLICDASGLMLEHARWGYFDHPAGVWHGQAGWHTEGQGLGKDLINVNHQWQLCDVWFRSRSGQLIKAEKNEGSSNTTLKFPDIEGNTYPHVGSGSTGLRYEYMWVRLDSEKEADYFKRKIVVRGRAWCEAYGVTHVHGLHYKPANNMLGALGVRALEAVQLIVSDGETDLPVEAPIYYAFLQQEKDESDFDAYVSNDSIAGATNIGRRNKAFRAYLGGNLSKYYRLRYRAGNAEGWGDWKTDRETAWCPLNAAYPSIDAICIQVVPRSVPSDHNAKTSIPDFTAGASTYASTAADSGKYMVGVARAVLGAESNDTTYLGFAATVAELIQKYVKIHFIADGEEKWVKREWPLGSTYNIPRDAIEACTRPTSTYLDKWYYDSGYSNRLSGDSFTPNDVNVDDYYIYCRNQYTLEFKWADETRSFFGAHEPYAETGLSTRLYESTAQGPQMVPSTIYRWHGNTLGSLTWHYTTAYVERSDAGGYMTTNAIKSVFTSKTATDSSKPVEASAKITGSATLYVVWKRPTYDGFDSN